MKKPYIIGIAGPSGSGKSTICSMLSKHCSCTVVHLDAFFRLKAAGHCGKYSNWEIPDSLMFDELCNCLMELKCGRPAFVPSKGWTERFDATVLPHNLIIVEGFILFLSKPLLSLLDLKVYLDISPETALKRRYARNTDPSPDYIPNCVIPYAIKHRAAQVAVSDFIIDGSKSLKDVKKEVCLITQYFID